MNITDYPINRVFIPSIWRAFLIASLLLGTIACAVNDRHSSPSGSDDKAPIASDAIESLETLPPGVAERIGLELEKTDPEVINHVLAGEFLGGEGDVEGAAEEYTLAAELSDDVNIAERATRISLQAQAWESVKTSAQRWLVLGDDKREPLQALAIAQIQLNEPGEVEQSLRQLILSSEPRSRGWQQVGTVLANANNEVLANDILQALIDSDDLGDSADSLYGQSVLAWRLGDIDRAKSLALQSAEQTERLDILEWAAQIAFAADDSQSSIGIYQRALEIAPRDRELSLAMAEILKRDGQHDAALEVLAGLGDNTEALYTRAAYHLDVGDRKAAEELYTELTELTIIQVGKDSVRDIFDGRAIEPKASPTVIHAFYTGQLAEQLDYSEQALHWYQKVDAGEYVMPAILRSARLLADLDRLPEAQALLQPLQNDNDEDTIINAFITESGLLQDAGHADQAVQRLTVALGRLSTNTDLLYARSLAAAANKDVDLAEQDLRRIIREDPSNAAALNALGYTLTDLTDRHDEALSLVQKALELNPTDAATLDSMGWINYRLGNLDVAEDYLRQAFELDENAEIGAHLGEVLWQQGAQQEARDIWQLAAQINASHFVLTETLQRFEVVL